MHRCLLAGGEFLVRPRTTTQNSGSTRRFKATAGGSVCLKNWFCLKLVFQVESQQHGFVGCICKLCVWEWHFACLFSADGSSAWKEVKGSAPVPVMGLQRSHALTRRGTRVPWAAAFLCPCDGVWVIVFSSAFKRSRGVPREQVWVLTSTQMCVLSSRGNFA